MSMKIGILTFHRSVNNGAFIQCFSLYNRIAKDFPACDIEVIDYHMPIVTQTLYPTNIFDYYKNSDFISFLKKTVRLIRNPRMISDQAKKTKAFERALECLPLSSRKILCDGVTELFDYINSTYDVIIAGSDAIWNYSLRGFPNPYFLDDSIKAKKFSYAASCFGMFYKDIPSQQTSRIREILESYDFIGVRDNETKAFAEYIGVSKKTEHTCDPTVLLDFNDLPTSEENVKKTLIKHGVDFSKPMIGVMGTDEMCQLLKKQYGSKYQIVSLFNYCKSADINLFDIDPFEWAIVFRFFKLTITSYFHGTLLSLKNGTPVVCMALNTGFSRYYESKVKDFLVRLNMADCYFDNDFSEENVKRIADKANQLLEDQEISERIRKSMEREAESYLLFYNALKQAMHEQN